MPATASTAAAVVSKDVDRFNPTDRTIQGHRQAGQGGMEMAFEFNTLHRGRGGVGPAERVAHLQMDDSEKRHGGPDLRPWSPDGGGASCVDIEPR